MTSQKKSAKSRMESSFARQADGFLQELPAEGQQSASSSLSRQADGFAMQQASGAAREAPPSKQAGEISKDAPPAKKQKTSEAPQRTLLAMFKSAAAKGKENQGAGGSAPAIKPCGSSGAGVKEGQGSAPVMSKAVSSGATGKKSQGKAAGSKESQGKVAESSSPALSDDLTQKAHESIDLAKNGSWTELWLVLDRHKVVNIRPEVREYSVLHQAAFHGDEDVVKTLLDKYGADPSLPTKFGELASGIAKKQGHGTLAKLLTSRFSSEKSDDNIDRLTPEKTTKKAALGPTPTPALNAVVIKEAHRLIDFAKNAEWDELYKVLDSRPELVNVRPDVREYGILHQAVYHGDQHVVDTLISKYGADPELRTRSGNTTACVATLQGHSQIAKSLSSENLEVQDEEEEADFDLKQMPDGSWKVVPKVH